MRVTAVLVVSSCLLGALAGCRAKEVVTASVPAADQPALGGADAGQVPASDPDASGAVAPAAAGSSGAAPGAAVNPAAASAAVIASQETNWGGVIAELTEFRRKGTTLTAKVRFRNGGTENEAPEVEFNEVYLMDAAAGKKYEVLKDEKGTYIASVLPGWPKRWYKSIKPAESAMTWMKFPAPPADVKSITLALPGVPPFDDVTIQD